MKRPFVLSTALTFTQNGAAYTPPDLTTLRSPFGRSWWLDEIMIYDPASTLDVRSLEVALRLRWRNHDFAPGIVSPILFGSQENLDLIAGGAQRPYAHRWRLPKPLFIPDGETVIPTLFPSRIAASNGGSAYASTSSTVRLYYFCHDVEAAEKPRTAYVPHVTAFTSLHTAATTYADQSQPPDLSNPYDVPFFVTSMHGYADPRSSVFGNKALGYVKTTTLRMFSPKGGILVRDKTLFGLFANRGAWNMPFVIGPRQCCTAVLEHDFTSMASALTTSNWMAHGISLSGFREVAL